MQRLTMRNKNSKTIDLTAAPGKACGLMCKGYTCDGCPVNDALSKLADYEDAEENGMLIHLPCRVGDEFWVIAYHSNVITHVKCSGYTVNVVEQNNCNDRYVWLDSIENPRDYWKLRFEEFSKQCFATREAAEQALKQMGE